MALPIPIKLAKMVTIVRNFSCPLGMGGDWEIFEMTCYLTSMPHWGHLSSQYEIALPILIKWQFKQGSPWSVWILAWFNTFIGDSGHLSNFFSEFFDSGNSCITWTSSRDSERIIFSSLISFWFELRTTTKLQDWLWGIEVRAAQKC